MRLISSPAARSSAAPAATRCVVKGTAVDLSSTSLTSIEKLQAALSFATTFTVDQADLASGGTVQGSSGNDTLASSGTTLDLSSTSLNSIEIIKAGSNAATTFTVDQADLVSGGTVLGSSGNDTLVINGTSADLTSTTLSSIEILKAGSSLATTFTVDQADLAASGTVLGSSGDDVLVTNATTLDLTSTTLSSVEVIRAGSTLATTFTLDQDDLAAGGTVQGGTGNDTVAAGGTALDFSSTTLNSIEIIKAGLSIATTFTVDQADLSNGGSVTGSSGTDTLASKGTALDLTSSTLTSIERLAAGSSLGTTFTVDAADLVSGGSVVGSSGTDTLIVNSATINLASTTLDNVEVIQRVSASRRPSRSIRRTFWAAPSSAAAGAIYSLPTAPRSISATPRLPVSRRSAAGSSLATTFTVDQADLASGGTVQGSTGSDTLTAAGTLMDLTSTTLVSIETLRAGSTLATTIIVDQSDLATTGSVTGNAGNDTLAAGGASLDLRSTVLTSVEIIKAGTAAATTFTVDLADLATGGSVVGSSGNDTLLIASTAYNLASTSLTSVEILQAGLSTADNLHARSGRFGFRRERRWYRQQRYFGCQRHGPRSQLDNAEQH